MTFPVPVMPVLAKAAKPRPSSRSARRLDSSTDSVVIDSVVPADRANVIEAARDVLDVGFFDEVTTPGRLVVVTCVGCAPV